MIPGELKVAAGEIELNKGRKTVTLEVTNTGDRPIQVGSHYHFFETNDALRFDRKAAYEERWLRQKYSEYADYARAVKKFIPGVY